MILLSEPEYIAAWRRQIETRPVRKPLPPDDDEEVYEPGSHAMPRLTDVDIWGCTERIDVPAELGLSTHETLSILEDHTDDDDTLMHYDMPPDLLTFWRLWRYDRPRMMHIVQENARKRRCRRWAKEAGLR